MKKERKSLVVDRQIQYRISVRIAVYWCASMLFVIMPLALFRSATDGTFLAQNIFDVCKEYSPVFLMLFLFLPFVLYDSFRFANLFAGPIHRLRMELKKRETGQRIPPISFREGDFCSDLPGSINALISQVDELEEVVSTELDAG